MNDKLKQQLDFILEIDKEKNILRQTHLSGHGRRENDAEHAWHMSSTLQPCCLLSPVRQLSLTAHSFLPQFSSTMRK